MHFFCMVFSLERFVIQEFYETVSRIILPFLFVILSNNEGSLDSDVSRFDPLQEKKFFIEDYEMLRTSA